jgi:hypothetical protein
VGTGFSCARQRWVGLTSDASRPLPRATHTRIEGYAPTHADRRARFSRASRVLSPA